MSRAELVERLGAPSPAEEDVTHLAASLQDDVGEPGA